ncbi:hypothetical protein J6590_025233 [Homalodisca vitripennis]|nr:hypothetical protein J6590_025233 [Homalodisca vitripennis]
MKYDIHVSQDTNDRFSKRSTIQRGSRFQRPNIHDNVNVTRVREITKNGERKTNTPMTIQIEKTFQINHKAEGKCSKQFRRSGKLRPRGAITRCGPGINNCAIEAGPKYRGRGHSLEKVTGNVRTPSLTNPFYCCRRSVFVGG